MEIILIGPACSGKSTQARLLSESLGIPRIALDKYKYAYFKEIGYDENLADEMMKTEGFNKLYIYWKPFEAHSVKRVLEDHKNCVIDFGAGHSVYDNAVLFHRVQAALKNYPYIVLLLPCPDKETSIKILNAREKFDPNGKELNFAEMFVNSSCNYLLAKYTVYTEGKTPGETCDEIIKLLGIDRDKKNNRITGKKIYLEKTRYPVWAAAREKRCSVDYRKYDPLISVINEADEREYYLNVIDSDKMELFGIFNFNEELIGYINAFEPVIPYDKPPFFFEDALRSVQSGGTCKTGIVIFNPLDRKNGFAYEAYKLFLSYLKEKFRFEKTSVCVYSENILAIKLYEKLGYKKVVDCYIRSYRYLKFEYNFT